MAKKKIFRVVTRGQNGELREKQYDSEEQLLDLHTQIGVDDCSTNLSLRGLPVFRGLIGPMTDTDNAVRYESPEVFESLTKEWIADKAHAKRRRSRRKSAATETTVEESPAETEVPELLAQD